MNSLLTINKILFITGQNENKCVEFFLNIFNMIYHLVFHAYKHL